MNIAIIYHDADFDGKLSNEVCRFHLRRNHPKARIHSYGWDYGQPLPTPFPLIGDQGAGDFRTPAWSYYDAIFIVDLSVDELMSQPDLMDKIVWIDHHKSAIKKWDTNPTCGGQGLKYVFDGIRVDGVAACRLCWQWFTFDGITSGHLPSHSDYVARNVNEPTLIRLAGEYDVWDHRDPNGKALQFGLRALSERDMSRLVENQFAGVPTGVRLDDVIEQGYSIKFYVDKQADEYSDAYAHTIQWEGLTFCALNIGQRGNSDLLKGGIRPEHDACFAWRFDGKQVLVSLYHIDGKTHHDLSLIAVKHGGGGHKGACGFRVPLIQLNTILVGGAV